MYRLSDIAAAIDPENAEARLNTIRTWRSRGIFVAPAGKAGSAARLSWHRAVQIAVTSRLADQGVPVPVAAAAALKFSDLGTGVLEGTGQELRPPGCPFSTGQTWLSVWREAEEKWASRLSNISDDEPWGAARLKLLGDGRVIKVTAVNCSEIVAELEMRLPMHDTDNQRAEAEG